MFSPPESVHRVFLSWDRPLLPQAVEFLARGWNGGGPLDLSGWLVVVPTRQAGRRLREALAGHAAERGAAVFPPRVLLPESLISAAVKEEALASRLVSLLAWMEVLREIELEAFRAVFPVDPPARNVAWALRLAQEFGRLRRTLGEGGLQLGDVAQRLGEEFSERERWLQLGELERLHAEKLGGLGLRDRQAAEIASARAPTELEGVEKIVVIGAPDPLPLALQVLEAHARRMPVEVLVFAAKEDAEAFDAWGRPRPEAWTRRMIEWPEFERTVHLCANPAAQAERIAELAAGYAEAEGALGVGVADADVAPMLASELQRVGQVAFNPDGRSRKGDALHQLLSGLAALAREETFEAVAALARCPDFLNYVAGTDQGGSAAGFLRDLDALHQAHLPRTLGELRRHAEHERVSAGTRVALAKVAELRDVLRRGSFPENASAALSRIFARRRFDLAREDDATAAEAAEAWAGVMRDVATAAKLFPGWTTTDWWDVALRLYGELVRYDDKPDGAVELQGWLELLWEDAPHLAVAGFNDGHVPDAVVGDAFLPESLRERLGLKTNAARFARDAYLLQALVAWRSGAKARGRIDFFLGKTSVSGDPLRPSRLLLRCPDEALPQRVKFLFRGTEAGRPTPAWRRAWKVAPRRVDPPARVAVTGLREWLKCPFRFYLSRVLRMEAVDPAKNELDAFDFGILCHGALEALGKNAAMRACEDAETLRAFLLGQLEADTARLFGTELTLPLTVQVESARQRLSRAAEVQAQTRAEGWEIVAVERPFEIEVAGLTVSGKIDRIDRHVKTGEVRVIDYKTSDRPVDPEDAHLRGLGRDETRPEFALLTWNARDVTWKDLQLPLYLRALATGRVTLEEGTIDPAAAREARAGYFNLPKAATETGVRVWEMYPRELDEAAWRCASGAAAAIQAGVFWPPNENIRPDQDAFAALFHHGVADSVAWEESR